MVAVSIIIPVYNVENYLRKCIDSVLAQTYKNVEIILVDDGSTDGSGKICDEYANHNPQICVIHQKNRGLSEARNVGIHNSKSNYIIFVDSDDYIHPNMTEILVDNLTECNADVSMCEYQIVTDDYGIENLDSAKLCYAYSGREVVRRIYDGEETVSFVAVCKLYSKTLFIENNIYFPSQKYYEDTFTTHKLLYNAKTIVISNKKLYFYRIRSGSIMTSIYNEKKVKDGIEADLEAIKTFEQNNDIAMIEKAYRSFCKSQIICYKKIMNSNTDKKEKKNYLEITNFEYKMVWKKYHKKVRLSILHKMTYFLFCFFPSIISNLCCSRWSKV